MESTKPPVGKKGKIKEVPVIQLVPPVIFIRKNKMSFAWNAVERAIKGILPERTLKKTAKNAVYSQSKRVYIK